MSSSEYGFLTGSCIQRITLAWLSGSTYAHACEYNDTFPKAIYNYNVYIKAFDDPNVNYYEVQGSELKTV